MSAFLQYYESELDYMHRALEEFARLHPQKARALGVSAGRSNDPDLQRVADSFALLAARLNHRLDATRPEISLDLLRLMAPGFLLGAPSKALIQVNPRTLEAPTMARRGTPVYHDEDGAPQSRFSVVRDVPLAPVQLRRVRTETAPFSFPAITGAGACEVALCLTIEAADGETPLNEITGDAIEFYVAAEGSRKKRICNALISGVLGIGLAWDENDSGTSCPADTLQSVLQYGDTAHLPVFTTQSAGLEMLRDFLCYPDKGAFFTYSGGLPASPSAEIRLFLSPNFSSALIDVVNDDLALNVLPCINLFRNLSQPVRYDYSRDRVPVTAMKETTSPCHILRLDALYELTAEGEVRLPEMFGGGRHSGAQGPYWQERHLLGEVNAGRREVSFSADGTGGRTVDFVAATYCSNDSQGSRPRPGAAARIEGDELSGASAEFHGEPTACIPPRLEADWQWDLLALVNGNFGAILEDHDPARTLRSVLNLCAPDGYSVCAEAIVGVSRVISVAPVRIDRNVIMATGSVVEIVIDSDLLPVPDQVFALVMDDFLRSFVSYDRFIELRVRARGETRLIAQFPRRHGSQVAA
jgi:type VI secretion system VasI/ImpG family protein